MLKKYLPKTLFLRYFLIILTPIIILQILLSVVFFDSLWIKTNKGLVNSLTEEINTVISFYNRKKSDVEFESVRRLISTNSKCLLFNIDCNFLKERTGEVVTSLLA